MAALADITTKANNTNSKVADTSTKSYVVSTGATKDETPDAAKSPRFMSPTVASIKQGVARPVKVQDQILPLSSVLSTHSRRANWMASAAKRVGLSRVSNGTPHSKKEGPAVRAAAFPDKVCLFLSLVIEYSGLPEANPKGILS